MLSSEIRQTATIITYTDVEVVMEVLIRLDSPDNHYHPLGRCQMGDAGVDTLR